MQLTKLTLHGFRRFKNHDSLHLPSRVFALIGPNEAGKSSVLRAIQYLTGDGAIDPDDLSRGDQIAKTEAVIRAVFTLDSEDFASSGQSDDRPTYLVVSKGRTGTRTFECLPEIDISEQLARVKALLAQRPTTPHHVLERAVQDLDQRSSGVPPIVTGQLESVLADINASKPRDQELASAVKALHAVCRLQVARPELTQLLSNQLPTIVEFTHPHRALHRTYEIGVLAREIPPALQHLMTVSGLDINELRNALGSAAATRRLVDKANTRLAAALHDRWTQSQIHISFMVHGPSLEIHVHESGQAEHDYSNIMERSDGLRQFVSLMGMLLREHTGRPIVLIDEAEQHLHYDAQADLIRMLHSQKAIRQVIYTTHSAGCLPDDLGKGVGGVGILPNGRSELTNNFWHSKLPDPSPRPILVAMGASALAFFPLRSAVLVEGISDAVLLPQLIRECSGSDDVGFQIVPGLAMATRTQLVGLAKHANSVAYVVDGDASGKEMLALLREAGVSGDRAVPLPMITIENCVNRDVYLSVVNSLLPSGHALALLPDRESWPNAIEAWCISRHIDAPSKIAVACALLNRSDDGERLLDQTLVQDFQGLWKGLRLAVGMRHAVAGH